MSWSLLKSGPENTGQTLDAMLFAQAVNAASLIPEFPFEKSGLKAQFYRPRNILLSLFILAQENVGRRPTSIRLSKLRRATDSFIVVLNSPLVLSRMPVRVTPVVVDPCASRVIADRLLVCSHCIFHHPFSVFPP
jgi:hypothetical protein